MILQKSYICTGSHDMRSPNFAIFVLPVVIKDEAWVCAGVFIHPGVTVAKGSVVSAGSILTSNTEEGQIYSGNPATWRKPRTLSLAVPPGSKASAE